MGMFLSPKLMVWRWVPWKRNRHCPACAEETMRVPAPAILRGVEALNVPYRRCRRCAWSGFDLAGRGDYAGQAENASLGGGIPMKEWMRAATLPSEPLEAKDPHPVAESGDTARTSQDGGSSREASKVPQVREKSAPPSSREQGGQNKRGSGRNGHKKRNAEGAPDSPAAPQRSRKSA